MIDDPADTDDTPEDKTGGAEPASPDNRERIAKRIARAGMGSRREAEAMIVEGRVAVNGEVITSPALDVSPDDAVTVDGNPLPKPERTRLWRYHKPAGRLVSRIDPHGRPTIYADLPPEFARLISVGRLDFNSEGLLLLTNDGELSRRLELPAGGLVRRYRARAFGHVDQKALDRLANGITVEGVEYGPIQAQLEEARGANAWIALSLREGKNREVRNVLAALGLQVNRLIRTNYGPFALGDLPVGAASEVPAASLMRELGLAPEKPKGWAKVKPRTNPMKTRKNQRPGRNARLARRAEATEHGDNAPREQRSSAPRFEKRDPRDHRPGDRRPSGAIQRERRFEARDERGGDRDRPQRAFGARPDERPRDGTRPYRAPRDSRPEGDKPRYESRAPRSDGDTSRFEKRPLRERANDNRPRDDRRDFKRQEGDKPRYESRGPHPEGKPRYEKRPFRERANAERPHGDEQREGKPRFENRGPKRDEGARPYRAPRDGDKPRFEKRPFRDRANAERPRGDERQDFKRQEGDKPRYESRGPRPEGKPRFEKRPFRERANADRPRDDRRDGDKPRYESRGPRPEGKPRYEARGPKRDEGARPYRKPGGDGERRFEKRPYGERTNAERPRGDRPAGDKPRFESRGPRPEGKPRFEKRPRPAGDKPRFDNRGERPAGPHGGDRTRPRKGPGRFAKGPGRGPRRT
ncbi:MAG TPA: pseudouridine synthase [Alphaproteobacteria bacterium]|nr:pseudouridine synthase [Alphaproteobacteria bacterium]